MNSKHKSPYGCLTNSFWISNLKPECVEVNQLESFVQKVQGFFAIDYVYVSKQELQSIKRHQGTWADALVIQAVAYALNLSLHIIE